MFPSKRTWNRHKIHICHTLLFSKSNMSSLHDFLMLSWNWVKSKKTTWSKSNLIYNEDYQYWYRKKKKKKTERKTEPIIIYEDIKPLSLNIGNKNGNHIFYYLSTNLDCRDLFYMMYFPWNTLLYIAKG